MAESDRTNGQREWFAFHFGESDVWVNPDDKYWAFTSHVLEREWERKRPADDDDLLQHYVPEAWAWSIDDLAAQVRESWLSDPDMPNEVVDTPFTKLASLMDRGGWAFVGGVFDEGEGQQPDTLIEVVLERKRG